MKKILIALAGVFLLMPVLTLAADFRTDSVGKNENVKNLYVAGQSVVTDANVKGDLVVAGNTVTVNGNVEQSLIGAAGTLTVKGDVVQNVRVAGGTVIIDGKIGQDLVIFGGEVTLMSDSVVNGDVIVASGTLNLRGKVLGSVKVLGAGEVVISGSVAGDVEAKATKVTIKDGAVISGKLSYSSPNSADISTGAKIVGGVKYTQTTSDLKAKENLQGFFMKSLLLGLIVTIFTVLLLQYIFPKATKGLNDVSFTRPAMNILLGFVFMIVAPFAFILALVTLIGAKIAFLFLTVYILLLTLAGFLMPVLLGSFTWKVLQKEKEYKVDWKTTLLGVVMSTLFALIPVIGWTILMGFYFLALGGFTKSSFEYLKAQRS